MEKGLKKQLDTEGQYPIKNLLNEITHLIQHEINTLDVINLFGGN